MQRSVNINIQKLFEAFLANQYDVDDMRAEPTDDGLVVIFRSKPRYPGLSLEWRCAYIVKDIGCWRVVWCNILREYVGCQS